MTDDAIDSMPPHVDAEQNTRYFSFEYNIFLYNFFSYITR